MILKSITLALLLASTAIAADTALSVPATATLTCTVPNSAPFTAMSDSRFVMRLYVPTFPTSGTEMVLDCGKFAIQLQAGGIINGINRGDTQTTNGNVQTVVTSGNGADVTIRFQRFGSAFPSWEASIVPGSIQMDVLDNVANAPILSYCVNSPATYGCAIDTAVPYDAHGSNGSGGSATAAFQIVYVKWFSTTVAPGSPMTESASIPNGPGPLADLADFAFEGNLTNGGTGCTGPPNACISITTSGTSFVAAPVQLPICQLTRQYFKAGAPATLSAVTYPLNGTAGITSQIWQQTAGTPLLFSSNTVPSPVVTGGVFGGTSPVFQLTVTDSSGNMRSCSVKDGFVATDANGVITSGNAQIDALIGPALLMGTSPVTWLDETQIREQTFQVANTTTYYGDNASAYWRIAGPGTIKVTQGLATVAGTSTTFTTTFCQGPGSPTLAKSTAAIEVWYPVSTAIVPSGVGRRLMAIASCTDDTHLTMTGVWNPLDSSRVQPNTGAQSAALNYNYSDDTHGSGLNEVWIAQQSQAGFYDTILARYIAYYRTGIDDYLSDARQFALNLIQHKIDWGNNYIYGESRQGADIYWSPLGIAMYALDGHPEAWPVLEQFADFSYSDLSAHFPMSENNMTQGYDARDITYHILPIAAAALADPNGYASTAKSNLGTLIANIGLTQDLSGGTSPLYGLKFYYGDIDGGAVGSNSWVTSSSVDLVNGSTAVTCHSGTTCGFNSLWFGPTITTSATAASGTTFIGVTSTSGMQQGQLVTGTGIPANTYIQQVSGGANLLLTRATTGTLSGTSITVKQLYPWGFTNNCSTPTNCPLPTNNSKFTGGVYYPAYGSATTMTLDRPFTGTSGNYGWTAGYIKNSPGILGYVIQPYEAGMIAFALDLARQGCTSPCTGGASALTYAQSIIAFIQANGYNATLKAPYYFAGGVNPCLTSPSSDLDGACFQAFSAPAARFDAGPLMRGISNVLLASYPNAGLQAFGDYLSSAEFGRPGFAGVGGQPTDAGYTSDYLPVPLGVQFFGPPPSQVDKAYGAAFGMGNIPAFMGARLGGLTAGLTSTISLQFNLASVPNATHVSVVDTEPYGGAATTSCSSSPCSISVTTGHGVHVLTLTYLSAGGATLAQSAQSAPLITAQ